MKRNYGYGVIDSEGNLILVKGGQYTNQYCPFSANIKKKCGVSCPFFEIKNIYKEKNGKFIEFTKIKMCKKSYMIFKERLDDFREK